MVELIAIISILLCLIVIVFLYKIYRENPKIEKDLEKDLDSWTK